MVEDSRMRAVPLKHILIISEESPGHLSQSKGFVEALRKEIDIKVDIVVGKTTLEVFYVLFFFGIFWKSCDSDVRIVHY